MVDTLPLNGRYIFSARISSLNYVGGWRLACYDARSRARQWFMRHVYTIVRETFGCVVIVGKTAPKHNVCRALQWAGK